MEKQKSWQDGVVVTLVLGTLLIISGQLIGLLFRLIPQQNGFMSAFLSYVSFLGIWLVTLLYCHFVKREQFLFAYLKKGKGNTYSHLFFGLLLGLVLNSFCIILAYLHNDFTLVFTHFEPLQLILLLGAVLIQSSAEEMLVRGFVLRRIEKNNHSGWYAMIVSSLYFACLHLLNPSMNILAWLNIFLIGLFFALIAYCYDSLWMAFGIHAAWNFTQAIIFGLPNSGIKATYSIFTLMEGDKSAFYNPYFGIEGTLCVSLLMILCIGAIVLLNIMKLKVDRSKS